MTRSLPLIGAILFFLCNSALAQPESSSTHITKQVYISQEGEMIFSFANIETEGENVEQVMRWSPVFNLMGHANYDFSEHFGVNLGIGFRNVGFIAKFPNELNKDGGSADIKRKFRTYNIGLPIGFKFGNLDQNRPLFLFGGYELELPIHYKEKYFDGNDKKDKRTDYFSDRVEPLAQSVFVGVQLPQGMALKFKYYLTNFFNKDYKDYSSPDAEGNPTTPYASTDVNVFYFSLNWYPFQNVKNLYDFK